MKPYKFTHCRCGQRVVFRGKLRDCPNADKEGEPAVYHDVVAQCYDPKENNWVVVKEPDGRFRPWTGGWYRGPETFATEREAWEELEKVYWGHKDWPEEDEDGPQGTDRGTEETHRHPVC